MERIIFCYLQFHKPFDTPLIMGPVITGVTKLIVWRAQKLPHKIWRAPKCVQKSLAGKIYHYKTQNRASLIKKHASKHDN